MLNVPEHLNLRFGFRLTFAIFKFGEYHVWRSIFIYASIIFGESKEPLETCVIKFWRKLSILQYL